MHVLQLGPHPPPEGGVSRNMLSIRDELLRDGNECTIIATTNSEAVAGERNVLRPRSAFALLKLISTLRFDVLHLHVGGEVTLSVIGLAAACSFFASGRCVMTLHSGGFPDSREGRLAKPHSIYGRIFRRFSRIIAVNQKIADVFRRYGVANEKVSVILPFSVQRPDENVVIPPSIAEFYVSHSPILLAVGGLEKYYDPLFQISVMKEVLGEFPNAGLVMVGTGSMRGEVERMAADSGYKDSILITGNVEHAVTLRLIEDADILLRTTLFDGDAIAVREALFLGTPVIATENGMRPDGVHLMDIGDSAGLVGKVKDLFPAMGNVHQASDLSPNNIAEVVALYKEIKDTNRS